LPTLSEAARRGEALLNLAGAKGKPISLSELSEAAEMILIAYARLFEPATLQPQTFSSRGQVTASTFPDIEILHVDYAIIAGVALAYVSRLTMRPEPAGNDALLWRQVDTKPQKLEIIDKTVGAFKAFVTAVKQQTGVQGTMARYFADNDDEAIT